MSRNNLQCFNERNERAKRSAMPKCDKNFRTVSIHLTFLAAGLLIVGCSNDSGFTDDPVDTGPDVMTDATPDAGPTPCEDAPTARLSATTDPTASNPKPRRNHTLQVTPISDIKLSSQGSSARTDHSIDRVEWTIEDRPEFAVATFGIRRLRRGNQRPLFLNTNDPDPTLQVGLTGQYEISLNVWNEQGVRACNTAELTVDVRPTSDLYVEFKGPFERVEAENEGEYLYKHAVDKPNLIYSFKRTNEADWNEDFNDVIPNGRAQTDVQDWGTPGDESDDPVWVDLYLEGPTNSFLQLDGMESDIPYFGAVFVSGTERHDVTPAVFKVYVNGDRKLRDRRQLGENHEFPVGLEVLRIEKTAGTYNIQPISTVYYSK